jgi:Reverse transcriptase (RNA-dependent DNA polymerase)/gag-polypeptide of LTR copia-type
MSLGASMDTSNDSSKFPNLKGELNYPSWRTNFKAYSIECGLVGHLDGSEVEPSSNSTAALNRWNEKDQLTRAKIVLKCDEAVKNKIGTRWETQSAKELWDFLKNEYAHKSLLRISHLESELENLRFNMGDNISEHLDKMNDYKNRLALLDKSYTDEDFMLKIAKSLRSPNNELENLIDSLEIWSTTSNLTISEVESRVKTHIKSKTSRFNESQAYKASITNSNSTSIQNPVDLVTDSYLQSLSQHQATVLIGRIRKFHPLPKRCSNPKCKRPHTHDTSQCLYPGGAKFNKEKSSSKPEFNSNNDNHANLANVNLQYDSDLNAYLCEQKSLNTTSKEPSKPFKFQELWFADSGCNKSLARSTNEVKNVKSTNNIWTINVAEKGRSIYSNQVGTLQLGSISLDDVLVVPSAAHNLLSINQLCKKGFTAILNDTGGLITKSSVKIEDQLAPAIILQRQSGHWVVQKSTSTTEALTTQIKCTSLQTWHNRLGHLPIHAIVNMSKEVEGLEYDPNDPALENFHCEACVLTDLPKASSPLRTDNLAQKVNDRIWSDLSGPFIDENDLKYYTVTFTDEKSRDSKTYKINTKTQAFYRWLDFKAWTERQARLPVQEIVFDGGKEYNNNPFYLALRRDGITYKVTVPYEHDQNGLSERVHRTLKKKARAMVKRANLDPSRYFIHAYLHANYLKSRTPTRSLDGKTPYEIRYGVKPKVGHLRTFGSTVYAKIPKEKLRKSHPGMDQAVKCRFLGCTQEHMGIKVENIQSGEIFHVKSVKFNEEEIKELHDTDLDNPPPQIDLCNTQTTSSTSHNNPNQIEIVIQDTSTPEKESEVKNVEDSNGVDQPTPNPKPALQNSSQSTYIPTRTQPSRSNKPRNEWQGNLASLTADSVVLAYSSFTKEPQSYKEAMESEEAKLWKEAIDKELTSIADAGTWETCTLPEGRKAIKCRWVFKKKLGSANEILRYKARLVAKGFSQMPGIDFDETFAPVARLSGLRLLTSIIASEDLEVNQLDVVNAFLNGVLEEEIFMEPPQGSDISSGLVVKLLKGLYGLRQASRVWWEQLDAELVHQGFRRLSADWGLYVLERNGAKLYLLIYVDDLLLASSKGSEGNKLRLEIKENLKKRFKMTEAESVDWILGIKLTRDRENKTLTLSQSAYITQVLERFNMSDCKSLATPMVPNIYLEPSGTPITVPIELYQQLVGCLMWLMLATRPDICQAVGQLSRFTSNPTEEHWLAAKHVLRYLKGTINRGIIFDGKKERKLVGYTDANWAPGYQDARSTTGYLFSYGGPISWVSTLQKSTAQSTTEAEYMALAEGAKEATYLRSVIEALDRPVDHPTEVFGTQRGKLPMELFCDNQAAIKLTSNPSFHRRTKHINTRYHYIRELVADKTLKITYVPTNVMLADMFTKSISRPLLESHCELIGMTQS